MKKALIVFLLLAMVAGGLFAQISFSGGATSGMAVAIEDDITFHVIGGPESWQSPAAFAIGASYTAESGKYGASGEMNQGGTGGNFWFKPVDILTVYAGDRGDYWMFAPPGGSNFDSDVGVGAVFKLSPMGGLDILASVFPFGGGNSNAEAGFGDARYAAAVKYGNDLFSTGVNLRYNGDWRKDRIDLSAGVDVKALASLGISSITLGVVAQNVDKLSELGVLTGNASVGFGFGAFSGGVGGSVYIPVQDSGTQDIDFAARINGSYPLLDGVTGRLGVGYSFKAAVNDTNQETFQYEADWNGLSGRSLSDEDTSVIGFRPSVDINLGFGSFNIGYGLLTNIGGSVSKLKSLANIVYSVSF